MNTALTDALLASGSKVPLTEYRGASTPVHFAGRQAEWAVLRSGCGIHDLGYRSRIVLGGKDRTRWLNGMISNNIRDLAVDKGVYAFLLNPQGHILGELYAYNRGETLVLDTDASQLEKITSTFKRYIIMDKVELAIAADLTAIGVSGPNARRALQAAGIAIPDLAALQLARTQCASGQESIDCTVVRRDTPDEGYELWVSAGKVLPVWNALRSAGASPVGAEVVETLRIVQGIPLYGVDIRERELPQETEQSRALNFSKGCYIGQEIVERIRARGNVHRKLAGFLGEDNAAIVAGAKVAAGAKEVGEITSITSLRAAGSELVVALGYIRREAGIVGHEVLVNGAKATVVQLPLESSLLHHAETASARG